MGISFDAPNRAVYWFYVREVDMDTTKLKVGQKVWMQSGNQFWQATISKITEVYMEVEPVVAEGERGFAIRFDRDGKQRIWERFTDLKDYSVAHIRDWPFGVYGWVDAWDPYRPMCGKGTIPYELVEQGPTAEGI